MVALKVSKGCKRMMMRMQMREAQMQRRGGEEEDDNDFKNEVSKMMSMFWIGKGMPCTESTTMYLDRGSSHALCIFCIQIFNFWLFQELYVLTA